MDPGLVLKDGRRRVRYQSVTAHSSAVDRMLNVPSWMTGPNPSAGADAVPATATTSR